MLPGNGPLRRLCTQSRGDPIPKRLAFVTHCHTLQGIVFVQRLLWDDWNVAHIASHYVSPQDVEEACHSDSLALASHTNRILLLGLTDAGKLLAVVLSPQAEEGVYYVVTARTAHKKERQYYREQKGGAPA